MYIIDFKTSNLKATILGVNEIEGLKRYKQAAEGAIIFWNKEKQNNVDRADENITFFTESLNLCESKIKKLTKTKQSC